VLSLLGPGCHIGLVEDAAAIGGALAAKSPTVCGMLNGCFADPRKTRHLRRADHGSSV